MRLLEIGTNRRAPHDVVPAVRYVQEAEARNGQSTGSEKRRFTCRASVAAVSGAAGSSECRNNARRQVDHPHALVVLIGYVDVIARHGEGCREIEECLCGRAVVAGKTGGPGAADQRVSAAGQIDRTDRVGPRLANEQNTTTHRESGRLPEI